MNRILFLQAFLWLLFSCHIKAQEVGRDSIYTKIEEFSDKREITKFAYQFIFRREADSVSVKSTMQDFNPKLYRGKKIGTINIRIVNPFGYDKKNRTEDPIWYDEIGEKIHIDSKESTISSYLLFNSGDYFSAQRIYESERLLRSLPFINRAHIEVKENRNNKNTVDIWVHILDSWSLHPSLSYSGNTWGMGLTEENIMGLGHEADIQYTTNSKTKQNSIHGSYTAFNVFKTFINTQIIGERDVEDNERVSLIATRDFFSPLTRWAGGLSFDYFKRNSTIPILNLYPFPETQIKVLHQNLWAGYQFPVFITDDKTVKNISLMGRYQNYSYKEKPKVDPNQFFESFQSLLASISYNERNYTIRNNVFKYNLPEDIPYGKSLGLTAGVLNKLNVSIPYLGVSGSFAEFTKLGYYNIKAEYGRFISENTANQNAFRIDGLYFTPLFNWNFAFVRHFFSPTYVIGNMNHHYSYTDRINLSSTDEFSAFSADFMGTQKLVLRYQMQFFINKTWKNFHFSPYITTSLGWLSQNGQNLFRYKTHTKFGIGVMIDNPYLIFNRFQVSFVYYPRVPFENQSVNDFNTLRNYQLPFPNTNSDIPHFVNFGN